MRPDPARRQSAPGWAGIVAILNQATSPGGSGAINPVLYDLGRAQYGAGGPQVLHDITSGDNGFDRVPGFAAGPGFDLATGWGTPDVAALVQALAPQACTGDCNGDGSVSIDEIVTAIDIALGLAPSSRCPSVAAGGDGQVTVDQVIQAVNHALDGC